MRFLLAGQPNSGKSTIFNAVAGYRAATANYPGSSVGFTTSRALILGREVEIVDLPGMYSLASTDGSGEVALHRLLDEPFDLIVNVVDASRLGRSLELTLQLLELRRPMIIALNMMDEAQVKGIEIDAEALARELQVPVVPTIGRRGRGLRALFRGALQRCQSGVLAPHQRYDREVEEAIRKVSELLVEAGVERRLPLRFAATKLLEHDPFVEARLLDGGGTLSLQVHAIIGDLQNAHGWTADQVVSGNRHAVAHSIEDRVAVMQPPELAWRERLDRLLLHPLSGGPIMLLILGGFFYAVFGIGQHLEQPLIALFERLEASVQARLPLSTVLGTLANGVVLGLSGGTAIVLPYLLPFLLGLAMLEDTGYLPRIAYILDSFMHRIGLHGKSVLPLILGYGCSVPAIMATRVLESKRDRRITAALTALIPCSARTIVIYGLVAAFMGPLWALFIYLLNIFVVIVLGNILARSMKGRSPGLILEIPDLRLPTLSTLLAKTWLSLKEFITIAWPLLIASSVVLGLLELVHADRVINAGLSPLTVSLLGLPAAVGMTLIFGVMRKELTLVMLVQALGTPAVETVLSTVQLMTFTLFVVFYVPCVATLAAMVREIGVRDTVWISALTMALATLMGVLSRIGFAVAG